MTTTYQQPNTIDLRLTQDQLELLLIATTRLVTYCTAQKSRGNHYAAAHIRHLVELNREIVHRLQILKELVPVDVAPAAQEKETP